MAVTVPVQLDCSAVSKICLIEDDDDVAFPSIAIELSLHLPVPDLLTALLSFQRSHQVDSDAESNNVADDNVVSSESKKLSFGMEAVRMFGLPDPQASEGSSAKVASATTAAAAADAQQPQRGSRSHTGVSGNNDLAISKAQQGILRPLRISESIENATHDAASFHRGLYSQWPQDGRPPSSWHGKGQHAQRPPGFKASIPQRPPVQQPLQGQLQGQLQGEWEPTTSIWHVKSWLRGHSAEVRDLAWSPDGSRLLTVSCDNTANFWGPGASLCRWQVISSLPGDSTFGARYTSVSWSPTGDHVAAGSNDKTARVWVAQDQAQMKWIAAATLKGHTSVVMDVAWSPDGRMLVTSSRDTTAFVWHRSFGDGWTVLAVLEGHTAEIGEVAWSPKGDCIITCSGDLTAKLWGARPNGACLATLHGHSSGVLAAAWSPDGNRIVTGSSDCSSCVWRAGVNLLQWEMKQNIKAHVAEVRSVDWSPDGLKLVTGSSDKNIYVYQEISPADIFQPIAVLREHSAAVMVVLWSPDGSEIASGSGDNTICLWKDALTL